MGPVGAGAGGGMRVGADLRGGCWEDGGEGGEGFEKDSELMGVKRWREWERSN